jgi:hypothetical protein
MYGDSATRVAVVKFYVQDIFEFGNFLDLFIMYGPLYKIPPRKWELTWSTQLALGSLVMQFGSIQFAKPKHTLISILVLLLHLNLLCSE